MPTQNNQQDHVCPKCRNELKRVYSKKKDKYYWACQGATEECGAWYPDADGKPKLPPKKSEPLADMPCPECTAPMQRVSGAGKSDFYSCSRYPDCKSTIDCAPNGAPAPMCPHDESHGHMRFVQGRNGAFWSCRAWKSAGCNATLEIDGSRRTRKEASNG